MSLVLPLKLTAGLAWLKAKAMMIVAALGAIVILCSLSYCKGRSDGRAVVQLQLEKANTRALQEKARADELAAERRLTDTVAINQRERELRDAIRQTPDEAPDAVRIRLGCEQLRRSGRDTSSLPACRGSAR